MRSRVALLSLVLAASVVVVPHLAHASIPFFGPIIPDASNTCPLGWGSVITIINNIIEFGLTMLIVFVAPLIIAYAGFLMVFSPTSIGDVSKARSILLNLVIGLVVALASWLIIDAVLVALTNQGISGWTALIGSQGALPCLDQAGTGAQSVAPATSTGVVSTTPGTASLSAAAIQADAAAAKKFQSQACDAAATNGIPTECAQILGIIGVESGGNPASVGPMTDHGQAIGLMQLLPSTAAANGVQACANSSNTAPSAACVTALKDPATNISAGTKLYSGLLTKFNGDETNATAAYNAGTGTGIDSTTGKKQPFAPSSDCPGLFAWQCTTNAGGFTQTQQYVPNVKAVANATGI